MSGTTQKPFGKRGSFAVHSPTQGTLRIEFACRVEAEAFGAALRRTLMRDVEGGGVSALRIDGVQHEFQSLPGVAEDVLTIIGRLRKLSFRLPDCRDRQIHVSIAGPALLSAADLACDDAVVVSDPGRVVATLSPGANLNMRLRVSCGTGFRAAAPGTDPGWIETDTDFSPIQRVGIGIEAADETAHLLTLTVATKGSLGPAEAVAEAATRLREAADADFPFAAICRAVIEATGNHMDAPVAPLAAPVPAVRDLSKVAPAVAAPELTGLQKASFEAFAQLSCREGKRHVKGLEALLRNAFAEPFAAARGLAYDGYRVSSPDCGPDDCRRLGRTYSGEFLIRLRRAEAEPVEERVADLPLMTERGTFVIRGVEKLAVGQLQADEQTRYNDLTTRTLLLVGQQLQHALSEPLAADLRESSEAGTQGFPRLAAAIVAFFGRGRFVRRAETTNPLTFISHSRAVVQCGLRRAPGYDARGVHQTHFGRICLLETPEGDRIGTNLSIAILADLDAEGRLLTPYAMSGSGEIRLLPPDTDAGKVVGDLVAQDGYHERHGGGVLARIGEEIVRVGATAVDCTPVHPAQAFGASASLIPFLAHDDANRALMGTNMQKQAVPLIEPTAPIVRTGMETRVAQDARVTMVAEEDGTVAESAADEITVRHSDGTTSLCKLTGFAGSSLGTSLRQRPLVSPGDNVQPGRVLADGPGTDHGVLALGRNVLVGYMPWEGYNYEDGTVISERLIRDGIFTSLKILEFVVTTSHLGGKEAETIGTAHLGPDVCRNLSSGGVVREGAVVEGGDVLVAKARPGEAPQDSSLRMPRGQSGTVAKVEHYSDTRGDALDPDVADLVRVTVVARRPLKVGDKLCNRHGAKGVVTRIVPEDSMPILPDGRALDVLLSPLGIPSRMNLGSILEAHLGLAAQALGCTVITPGLNGASVADIGAMLREAGLPESGMFRLRDGRTGRCFDQETTVGVLHMMKLTHMVDDKRQERSVGSYDSETQQPVGGRRHGGGQRFGVMETWALQGHGAATILQEMLTVKSDDVESRARALRDLTSGTPLPQPTAPHSLRRLAHQLRGLCIDMKAFSADGDATDLMDAGRSVNDMTAASVEIATPETVLEWSVGEVRFGADGRDLEKWPTSDDRLGIGHLALSAPVAHAWRALVKDWPVHVPQIAMLPVLPPSLRSGRRLACLYAAVNAANISCANEGMSPGNVDALQAAVDDVLNALTRLLYGKTGWITAAISGKTVDFSARSVICPGPDLAYDTCSLPTALAAALFEPAVIGALLREGLASSASGAKGMLDGRQPAAMELLRHVIEGKYVLLHRAPTLHRMGIQAFRVRLADEDVIRVHPLTMVAFNADFDGDEMDVFLPLSEAAQLEAQHTLRSSRCQLGPANGTYMNTPTQDMVFGCYYATCREPAPNSERRQFETFAAVDSAFASGLVHVHDTVVVDSRVTTVGKVLFNRLLPHDLGWIDEPVSKAVLRKLFTDCWHGLDPDAAAALGDRVMRFGFHHATLSGLSLGKDVLIQYTKYDECLAEAWRTADEFLDDESPGAERPGDTRRAILDHWMRTTDEISAAALTELAADRDGLNPLHLMLASGARGNTHQVRQLVAMRGLMAMPDRRIIATPFTTTFIRGHSPLEYFASAFGARKGLADTALKTAGVGFLFKRVVSAVQDVVLSEDDCGCAKGVVKAARYDGQREWFSLSERIVGRTALEDVLLPDGGALLVRAGEIISVEKALAIAAAGIRELEVRSPVNCRSETGLCAACYGLDLATYREPALGLAVGVLAAQSIGEPATQLTMRTFVYATPSTAASADDRRRTDILGGLPRLEQLLEAWGHNRDPDVDERRDVCRLLEQDGRAAAAEYLLVGMQKVYRQQGVRIDDRHFEVILRQMLRGPLVGVTETARNSDDFIAAGSSHGGMPALAAAVARGQRVPLAAIRNCTAFGKLIPSPDNP